MASHLESLIHEYLELQGYLLRRNIKVGRLVRGGWEMELDLIAYNPQTKDLVHYEPSLDALSWAKREVRFRKKFAAARKYLYSEILPWLPPKVAIHQFAVLPSHPVGRDNIGGGIIVGVDELMAQIREIVMARGAMSRNAIPEGYPLLRTLQLSHAGYYRAL